MSNGLHKVGCITARAKENRAKPRRSSHPNRLLKSSATRQWWQWQRERKPNQLEGSPLKTVAVARAVWKTLGPRRVAIVGGVGVIAGLLIFVIRGLGDGKWDLTGAIADFIKVFTSSVIIVGLLDWSQQHRWQRADQNALASLALTTLLAASGWSNVRTEGSPDLSPAVIRAELAESRGSLTSSVTKINQLYEQLRGARKGRNEEMFLAWSQLPSTLESYYSEGSRARRLSYLQEIVDTHLPALIERRDDPELSNQAAVLRNCVASAKASAQHTDTVILAHVLDERPPVLEPFLTSHGALSLLDPVFVLAGALKTTASSVLEALTAAQDPWRDVAFANRCLGGLRQEMWWIADALTALDVIVEHLNDDMAAATAPQQAAQLASSG